jgi:hypothetical protein
MKVEFRHFELNLSVAGKNEKCKSKVKKGVPLRHAGDKGERIYRSYSFLTSILMRVTARPRFTTGKDPGTHLKGGWVGLRASLDSEATGKILCLCRGSNLGCPVCSQALY